jgi:hypothetical protein
MRKKNRICQCGHKFKEHPIVGCDWKPKNLGGVSAGEKQGDKCRPKLWSDRFKPHKPFLEAILEIHYQGSRAKLT